MDKFNLPKDHGTFSPLIQGFGRPETFEECWKYYTSMKAKKLIPFAGDIKIVVQACPSYKSEIFSELLKDVGASICCKVTGYHIGESRSVNLYYGRLFQIQATS